MRKIVSMSALVSGLLAAPLFAAAKPVGTSDGPREETAATVIQAHLDAVTGGLPMEAERMQALHRRMLEDMQARMDRLVALQADRRALELSAPLLLFVQEQSGIDWRNPGAESPIDDRITLAEPPGRQMEKAAFLGVATSPVTATLRDQLKLQRGMGLVVDFIAQDSPAAHAGIQPHDVLEKLDDQWLINGQQFAVLVRAKKPGDTVTLTIIRAAAPISVTVKLAEKELPVLDEQDAFRFPMNLPVMPGAGPLDGNIVWQHGSRRTVITSPDGTVTRTLLDPHNTITLITKAGGETALSIKDNAGKELYAGPYTTDADKTQVPADFAQRVQELAQIRARVRIGDAAPAAAQTQHAPASMTMVRSDADHQIVLRLDDKGKSLIVKDAKTGHILFQGPINTDAQLNSLPPGVAEKVKWMEEKMKVAQ